MIYWDMFTVFLGFGELVNFIVSGCLVGDSLATWLIPLHCPNLLVYFFLLASSPHYSSCKILLIIMSTMHPSGGEFETLSKHMVNCIFGMSFE